MELGDCLELMARIPDGSVDGIITDPPYGSGGDSASVRMRNAKSKYVSTTASYQSTLPEIHGDNVHPEAWAEQMARWARECRRVLAKDGVFAVFIDWRNTPTLYRIVMAAGIRVRGVVVWDKGQGCRPYRGGFRMQSEFVLWGGAGHLPRDDIYLPGVIKVATKNVGKMHILEKPVSLMRQLVLAVRPGGLILDPFAGSSSTGVAALLEGYQYHGIESVPDYFKLSCKRLREAARGQGQD